MLSDEEKKAYDNLIMLKYFTQENEDKKAIQIILDLIEKQQKEIEELKEKIKTFKIEDENIYLQFGEITEKKRWKDKIKTKIEECREILYSFEKELELKANKDKFIHKESMNCLLGQISILQSLL